MRTVTVDILNNKVLRVLQDLEQLQLLRLRKEKTDEKPNVNWSDEYKGKLSRQSQKAIDRQLKDIRNSWE